MEVNRVLQTSFLNLLMADKHGTTLAKGCPKLWGTKTMVPIWMIFLQTIGDFIYLLEIGYITIRQIQQLLFGAKRFCLTTIGPLRPQVRQGYWHSITRKRNFCDIQLEPVHGHPRTRILNRRTHKPFLKLPEA